MLPRQHRLRGGRDFEAVYAAGRRTSLPLLGCHVLRDPGESDAPSRFAFVTSRKVGKACVRNKVRRRLRAAVRRRLSLLVGGCRVVLVARPAAADVSWPELAAAVDNVLLRAGLLPSTEPAAPK
ncbi:MAG: ribonuclease P protein component [Candidatus Sericytochromatia bacterium]|nr:ribonuclease P protein component [Candidatus Sericytochromatia bacterium]